MNYRNYVAVMASGAVATTLLFSQITPAAAQDNRTFTLDSGTVIPVKLQDTLSSTDSRKGDHFTATLQSEDAARSLHLPRGTHIEGTVASVRPMHDKDPGVISLNFNRIVLPNESSYPIQGSLIGLDDKSVRHTDDGRIVAKDDHKSKPLVYAGYGAGAGLVLGAITKGNTILDTLLGGGLGYLLGKQDKSHGEPKDVTLKPDTELGVRLDRSVDITPSDDHADGGYTYQETRPRTDRNDSRNGSDRNTGDDRARRNQDTASFDPNPVLKQFTDIQDNGQPIRALVEGQPVAFASNARPFIADGVVMVPVAPVLRAARIHYTYASSQFTVDGSDETLTLKFGSRVATGREDHRFLLPSAVQRRNGTVYVPIQFLAIATGERLSFDRDRQTVELGRTHDNSGDQR